MTDQVRISMPKQATRSLEYSRLGRKLLTTSLRERAAQLIIRPIVLLSWQSNVTGKLMIDAF
jgi:hypothetical protein